MSETPVYHGGCRCGAVRYVATGAPINQRICHCRICQKAIGAAFNARLLFAHEALSIDGPATYCASSPAIDRGFCAACGTTLFSRRTSPAVVGVTSGSLDDPAAFRPDMHIFTASRQPWLRLDDGLPCFEQAPPG